MPEFTVIMPVYNGATSIEESLDSIINQTLKPTEIIIINDGSTDNTLAIIQNYILKKKIKIKIISNSENRGLCFSLNLGINKAKYNWIARMDVDDISLPGRFEKQFKYIIKHQLDVCGTFIAPFSVDYKKKLTIETYPTEHLAIINSLLFSCPLAHPSIIYNKKKLGKSPYDVHYEKLEDYALWIECAINKNVKFGNIPEPLIFYRVSETQYSKSLKNELRDDLIYKLRSSISEYIFSSNNIKNFDDFLKFLEYTKTIIRDKASINRLKNFSMNSDNFFDLTLNNQIRLACFAGLLIFIKSKMRRLHEYFIN